MSTAAQTANEWGLVVGTKVEAGVHGRANSASMNFGFTASQLRFCSAIVCILYIGRQGKESPGRCNAKYQVVAFSNAPRSRTLFCRSDNQMLNLWETV